MIPCSSVLSSFLCIFCFCCYIFVCFPSLFPTYYSQQLGELQNFTWRVATTHEPMLSAHHPSELEASSVSAWWRGGEEVSRTPLWKCSFNMWRMLRGLKRAGPCGWLSFQSVRSCTVGAPPSIRLWGVKWGVRPRCFVRLALKQHWTPTELMHMQNCISYSRVTKLHTLKRQEKHAKEQWWAMCYSQHPAYVLFVDGGGERAPAWRASLHLSLQCFQFIRDLLISKRRLVKAESFSHRWAGELDGAEGVWFSVWCMLF